MGNLTDGVFCSQGVHRNVRIGPTATLGHPGVPRPARPGRTHVRRVRRRHRGDAATTPDDAVSRADPHFGTQNVSFFISRTGN